MSFFIFLIFKTDKKPVLVIHQYQKVQTLIFRTSQLHLETTLPENGQVNGENIQKQKFNIDFWVTQRPFWIKDVAQ
ncbi:hypothetical protein [Pediococcus damnosus]|uniref:hypothetical protein n=1 Tax=Pediococcus damnosus TaxID=51663 RepID=UPI000C1C9A6B|nr:hypothetical protein [Pediococcus damnosus]PIO85423.1 hypothetical protein BSQ37_05510 [Pediococcus damnosus]